MSTEQPGRSWVVDGVVTAGAVGVWYAMPDVVSSRPARGLLKLALLAGSAAHAVVAVRSARAAAADDGALADDDGALTRIRALTDRTPVLDATALGLEREAGGDGPRWPAPRALAVGTAVVAGSLAATVAVERGVHRFGEHLAARGVRAPHTRIGVVAALLTAAATVAGERMERTA